MFSNLLVYLLLSTFNIGIIPKVGIPEKVIIKSVSLDIMTIADVLCDRYEESFNYRTTQLKDSVSIDNLIWELNSLSEPANTHLDARIKIELYYRNMTKTICIDRFTVEMNGIRYNISEKLLDLLQSLDERQ